MYKKRLKRTVLVSGFALVGFGLFAANPFQVKDKLTSLFNEKAYESEEDEEGERASIAGAAEYYNSIKADLRTGQVDPAEVAAVDRELSNKPRAKALGSWINWDEVGPDNVGGRSRSLIIDREDNRVIYSGGVSGGMWKSMDGGTTWSRIGNLDVNNINVSCLTQTADGDLFYGTGESGFLSIAQGDGNSGFRGRGMFTSKDKGATWTQIVSTDPGANVFSGAWVNVHSLNSHPTNPDKLFAGNDGGLYVSNNGGTTWTRPAGVPNNQSAKAITISPDGNTVLFASANGNPGSSYQLWRSTDAGNTFARVGTTTISSASCSYVIGISTKDPNVIYLSSASSAGTSFGRLEGIYKSIDNGATWAKIATGDAYFNPLANQGYYDHCIAIDPTNENRFFIAGLNMWQGTLVNGVYQFSQMTNWSAEFFGGGFRNPAFVHADQHVMMFDRSETRPALYIASDGGVSKSVDITYSKTPSFFNADYGVATVQFYGIGISSYDKNEIIGGTQDNGVIRVDKSGITLLNGTDIKGGDGGYSEISLINPSLYFGEYIYGDISRSFTKGSENSWANFFDQRIPPAGNDQNNYEFIVKIKLWEKLNDFTSVDSVEFVDVTKSYKAGDEIKVRSKTGYIFSYTLTSALPMNSKIKVQDPVQSKFIVATKGKGIWLTKDASTPASSPEYFRIANAPGFSANDFEFTPDGNTLFASGKELGNAVVYRITGLAGKKFQYRKFAGSLNPEFRPDSIGIVTTKIYTSPGQVATGIYVDPKDANHVLMSLGNYGFPNHVFRSKNAMSTTANSVAFTNITSNLPRFPVYDVLISSKFSNEYIIGTEYGVWASKNQGTTWTEENLGMERVPVFELRQMTYSNKPWAGPVLFAATHGRGVFRTSTLETGIFEPLGDKKSRYESNISVYPNPANAFTNLKLNVAKQGVAVVNVFDITGRLVQTNQLGIQLSGERTLTIDTDKLKVGSYFARVQVGGETQTVKFSVVR